MEFGTNLQRIRKEKGLSQKDLTIRTGIDSSQLSRYENGISCPSLEAAARIAEALEVKLDVLAGG